MLFKQILVVVTLCIPLPSNQHFIWPMNVCLMADICNHTWIPECGRETTTKQHRIFLDECDVFEYNCDSGKNYVMVNYSECFVVAQGQCPTVPCPSHPPCRNHRYHRIEDRYIYPSNSTKARRMLQTVPLTPPHWLPPHMLHGRRRYTPIPMYLRTKAKIKKKLVKTTKKKCTYSAMATQPLKKTTLSQPKQRKTKNKKNVVLKKGVVKKISKKVIKIVKGKPTKAMKSKNQIS